jgi:hypothetical protein
MTENLLPLVFWTSYHPPEDSVQKPRARFPELGIYHLLEFISRLLDPLPVVAVYHKDEALGGKEERKQKGSLLPRSHPHLAWSHFSHLELY